MLGLLSRKRWLRNGPVECGKFAKKDKGVFSGTKKVSGLNGSIYINLQFYNLALYEIHMFLCHDVTLFRSSSYSLRIHSILSFECDPARPKRCRVLKSNVYLEGLEKERPLDLDL